ncbi:MAG TPA: hypothetical protein ENI69_03205 [Rhodospirillales bacterium]|nr:hypothetical protein [Rhodospirillales bacterium]
MASDGETFAGNAEILQFFGNNDLTTTEYISKRVGKTRVAMTRESEVGPEQREMGMTGRSNAVELHELLTPKEINRHFACSNCLKRQLVIWAGYDPLILQQVEYFDRLRPVSAARLGNLLDLIADDTISGRIAKDVFEIMVETGQDPATIVDEKGLKQITDTSAIEGAIDQVIADNPAQVEQFRSGNEKIIGWFVGQVMKSTGGKANPGMLNKLLREKLKG